MLLVWWTQLRVRILDSTNLGWASDAGRIEQLIFRGNLYCSFKRWCSMACLRLTKYPPHYTSYKILLSALGQGAYLGFDLCKLICSFSSVSSMTTAYY